MPMTGAFIPHVFVLLLFAVIFLFAATRRLKVS
jgi:hypothetical protein